LGEENKFCSSEEYISSLTVKWPGHVYAPAWKGSIINWVWICARSHVCFLSALTLLLN